MFKVGDRVKVAHYYNAWNGLPSPHSKLGEVGTICIIEELASNLYAKIFHDHNFYIVKFDGDNRRYSYSEIELEIYNNDSEIINDIKDKLKNLKHTLDSFISYQMSKNDNMRPWYEKLSILIDEGQKLWDQETNQNDESNPWVYIDAYCRIKKDGTCPQEQYTVNGTYEWVDVKPSWDKKWIEAYNFGINIGKNI